MLKPSPSWQETTSGLPDVFQAIADGRPDLVLVRSMPRTGSKYLRGVLQAIYGINLAGSFNSTPGRSRINPGHCHGLSDARLKAVQNEEKIARIREIREKAESAREAIIFTISRPERQRVLSAFLLQKQRLFSQPPEKIRKGFRLFASNTSEQRWADEECATLGVPSYKPGSLKRCQHLRVEGDRRADHIVLGLNFLDETIEKCLYPIVSQDRLAAKLRETRHPYGPHNRNSTESRNLAEARAWVQPIIADLLEAIPE